MSSIFIYRCLVYQCSVLAVFGLMTATSQADIATFNVDLSGVEGGEMVSVFGTLTVDTDAPIDESFIDIDLLVQLNNQTPSEIVTTDFLGVADVNDSFDWSVDSNGDLYISRTTTASSAIGLLDETGGNGVVFGSGPNRHFLVFIQSDPLVLTTPDLLDASGPDGPFGFLVGTAVPEPSAAAIIISAVGITMGRRRRR